MFLKNSFLQNIQYVQHHLFFCKLDLDHDPQIYRRHHPGYIIVFKIIFIKYLTQNYFIFSNFILIYFLQTFITRKNFLNFLHLIEKTFQSDSQNLIQKYFNFSQNEFILKIYFFLKVLDLTIA